MLNIIIRDKPVCVCVLRILVTEGKTLPFSKYITREYTISYKIRGKPEALWRYIAVRGSVPQGQSHAVTTVTMTICPYITRKK